MGPTKNNNTCNIPFTSGSVERYFCANTAYEVFKCQVGDKDGGNLDDCIRGRIKAGILVIKILIVLSIFINKEIISR